ncbi:MAG: hypothetical protein WC759_03410 [Candidatus Micrarchaeia archaeon]
MVAFEELSAQAKYLEKSVLSGVPSRLPSEEGKQVAYRTALEKPLSFQEVSAEARRLEKIIAASQYGSTPAPSE